MAELDSPVTKTEKKYLLPCLMANLIMVGPIAEYAERKPDTPEIPSSGPRSALSDFVFLIITYTYSKTDRLV